MTAAESVSPRYSDTDRNLAMVIYGLMVAAIFFAGVPALIGVIIAYAQRDNVSPALAQHHRFQIRIFWAAFILSLIAGVCALTAAVLSVGDIIAFSQAGGWDKLFAGEATVADMRIDTVAFVLIGVAILLSILTGLWLIAAPAVGFIRLANISKAGQQAA